ncbi:helix-turn-helix domain-containing protein [Salipaludibacillus sp. LMS25]|jgi:predicted transcriptional regulator|uniref:ArsR/SmtB family transcription factor n=1 Tax=Salipaludibacillus sp. LMS25 TaxID=2924031 RepID=UPI0020D11644|nr:helix-turn-helix domain-containing protein [Salipaludibacillus sp. LMS25]UTR16228.1 helix-turn-helix domain-containing protein [Salipaludibacillus sp. LMS25]
MQLDISTESLPVYEALASKVRISIIQELTIKAMNIRELAEAVGVSSAIMTMHIKKLEKASIIRTEMIPGKAGIQKLCILDVDSINILFPSKKEKLSHYHQSTLSVGHYTDFNVLPTCGLATEEKIIGQFDEPRYFLDPERVNAKILWFSKGHVEYKIPNFLNPNENPKELEISLELSSEAPFTNEDWPSDITFYLNNHKLGIWTSPGDFGDSPGKYTPDWWPKVINQYGLLKSLRINNEGTFIENVKMSDVTIGDVDVRSPLWSFKLAVLPDAKHVGGLTIFGKGFGNYNQDILFRLYYKKRAEEKKITKRH